MSKKSFWTSTKYIFLTVVVLLATACAKGSDPIAPSTTNTSTGTFYAAPTTPDLEQMNFSCMIQFPHLNDMGWEGLCGAAESFCQPFEQANTQAKQAYDSCLQTNGPSVQLDLMSPDLCNNNQACASSCRKQYVVQTLPGCSLSETCITGFYNNDLANLQLQSCLFSEK